MCIHKRLSDEEVRRLLQQINIMLGVPWCLNFAIFTLKKPFFTLKLHILLSSHLLTIHLHFFSIHSSDFHNSSFLQTLKPRSSCFEKDRYPSSPMLTAQLNWMQVIFHSVMCGYLLIMYDIKFV